VSERRLEPPGGDDAPTTGWLGERELDLTLLAREICRRYREEFPDEEARYGVAGYEWCVHDNQYLLCWATEDVNGHVELMKEVAWLAGVLEARHFPLERLARNLDIAADEVLNLVRRSEADRLASVLRDAATFVRSQETFLIDF
jgi:hypothetical protein